ncbi:hypothetical protein HMPREF0201_00575 [Cedecea davisae DSM 4568]|uniref:Uncharacterized protein n=1 Tax=Cedecea davisae DSM 4568 TaxID=566551 RepID=S3J6H4_9ENTR|nr:hypothetical protein HMPREF0201_00575 [Cedecea davisae DSM 4568]
MKSRPIGRLFSDNLMWFVRLLAKATIREPFVVSKLLTIL